MATIEYVVKAVDQLSADMKRMSASVDGLQRNLDKLGKTRSTPAVDLADKVFTAKMDDVKTRLDDLSKRVATARADVADKDAIAKLAAMQVRLDALNKKIASPKIDLSGLDRADAQLLGLDASLDRVNSKLNDTKTAADAAAGAGGAGGGGIGALIGAGVALAPVVATLGVGLTGLVAAGYGVVKPISAAAQATGGLQKNLKTLDPEQRAVAVSLLALGKDYGQFQASLKPTLLADFGDGLRLVRNLMHDVQPVSLAVGKDIGILVNSLNKDFQGQQWQQFFGFMAGPGSQDVQSLDSIVVKLVNDVPQLVMALQPLTRAVLTVGNDAANAVGPLTHLLQTGERNFPLSTQNTFSFLRELDRWTVSLTNHIPGAKAVNDWLTNVQHDLSGAGSSAAAANPRLQQTNTIIRATAQGAALVISPFDHLGKVADTAAGMEDVFYRKSSEVNVALAQQAHQLNIVAAQYEHGLTRLENYVNAQIAEGNDLHSLNQALRASHDMIGLKTQAERNSYAAAQTYISQTLQQGNAALAAHKGIDGQITSIRNALPALESVRGKTQAYRQELQLLKDLLDKLRAEKTIQEQVKVFGTGAWSVKGSGVVHGFGGHTGAPMAAGGVIRGGVPGRDSVLMLGMPGEVVVPTSLVRAGAVDHLRGRLPGFAAGGIVPSYSGSVAGLPPWTSHNQQATITAITDSIARSFASGFMSSLTGGGTGGFGSGSIPSGGVAALALQMARARGWGNLWGAISFVEMAEAGWNLRAQNPSSGAYGIAQFINGPGEYYQYGGNPNTAAGQITGFYNYMAQRYGGPVGAAAHERAFHWYGNGLPGRVFTRPQLIGVGDGGPERVTVEPLSRGGGDLGAKLDRVSGQLAQLTSEVRASSGRTGQAVGDALNGVARGALYAGWYRPSR